MKNFILYFFAALGFIFLIILIWLSYFIIADPYNLKPLLLGSQQSYTETRSTDSDESSQNASEEVSAETGTESDSTSTNTRATFNLSPAQKEALINLGISPESVPDSISVEQEQCFVNVLGESRVAEIRAGAVPGAIEFFKAKSCI